MCLQPQGEGALCRQLYQIQPDDGIWQNKINPVGELLRGTRGQKAELYRKPNVGGQGKECQAGTAQR